MKKVLLICASLLTALVSCSSSDDNKPSPSGSETSISVLAQLPDITTKVSFEPNGQANESVIAGWQASDAINVYAINGGSSAKGSLIFEKYPNESDKHQATFTGQLSASVSSGATLYSFVKSTALSESGTSITFNLSNQDGSANGLYKCAILYGQGTYTEGAATNITYNYKSATAKFAVTLPSSVTGSIKKISLIGEGLYSSVTLNATTGELENSTEGGIEITPTSPIQIANGTAAIYATLYPNTLTGVKAMITMSDDELYEAEIGDLTVQTGLNVTTIAATDITHIGKNVDLYGFIRDENGNPIADVVVSDGYTCTTTGANGLYAMKRNSSAKFVFFSAPADCEIPTNSATDNSARFYEPLTKSYRYDFALTKLPGGPEINHTMIVLGDPQILAGRGVPGVSGSTLTYSFNRFKNETMVDLNKTISSISGPVYGLCMGDEIDAPSNNLQLQVRETIGSTPMKVFSVIGNHDKTGTSWGFSASDMAEWENVWGPRYYSFNRGDVHYISLDDVDNDLSSVFFSDEQVKWLKQDLSYVPKDKMIVISYHIPLAYSDLSSYQAILSQLSGYQKVVLFSGHSHFADYADFTNPVQAHEYIHAASCGSLWSSYINLDTTPNGYYVYSVEGTDFGKETYFKATAYDRSKQISLFRADDDFKGYSYAKDLGLPTGKNIIIANVYNANTSWKVYAYEGASTEGVELTKGKQIIRDAYATGYHCGVQGQSGFWGPSNSYIRINHLYYYQPTDPEAEITIKAVDPYGNEYVASSSEIIPSNDWSFAQQ